jgi:cobyrinic acid a,c-diamide synthase
MVLGRSLADAAGVVHPMAGLLPVDTSYAERRMHLGYRVATLYGAGVLGAAGARLVGHEFHYASLVSGMPPEGSALASVADGEGVPIGPSGHQVGTVSGSFFHAIATA